MKDLIIGCSHGYSWKNLWLWINSINACGFNGDKVLIVKDCDEETIKIVESLGFIVIRADRSIIKNSRASELMPIHVERFIYIYDYLKKNNYRYVVTTDVRDVIFQKNPVEFIEKHIENKNLLFASESMIYKDEVWGNKNLHKTFGQYIYDDFKESEIYNVGVLAGTGPAVKDMCLNIFVASCRGGTPICDQSTFNLLIATSPYKETSLYLKSKDAWTAQIGTLDDPSRMEHNEKFLLEDRPIIKNNKISTADGNEFYIVHQYDRNYVMKKLVEDTYL
jgi:hypothetical protein